MNPIQFECPHCHEINTGDESHYGQRVQCSKCKTTFLVPEPPAPELKTARLIGGTTVRPAPGPTAEEETEVFHLSPVARAYLGQILLALIFVALAAGLKFSGHTFDWVPPWGALVLLVFGGFLLLMVWAQVKSSSYRLTTQRLFVRRGWLAKRVDELELYRVKDVRVDQSVIQRLLGYGTITVVADDETTPQMELVRVARPIEIKENIRTHYRAARQREGVHPTEFIRSP